MEDTFQLTSALPVCVALRSKRSGNSLCYDPAAGKVVEQIDGHGDPDDPSPYTVFRIEASEKHSGHVHLRCCSNNKYWAAQPDGGGWAVVAADEPDEDLSKPSCTLFKLIPVTDDSIRLLHSQLGRHAFMASATKSPNTESCLRIFAGEEDKEDSVLVYSLQEEKRLPRYVAFKGSNGRYICRPKWTAGRAFEFTGTDIGGPGVFHTVEFDPRNNGNFRLLNDHHQRSWLRGGRSSLIGPDFVGTNFINTDAVFQAVDLRTADGEWALRNVGNNRFCSRYIEHGEQTELLASDVTTITNEARLLVEEPVVSRQIYNVRFRLAEARIYNRTAQTRLERTAVNGTGSDVIARPSISHTHSAKSKWESSRTMKTAVKTTINAKKVAVAEGGVTVETTTEYSGAYNWGESVEETSTQEVAFRVVVPPSTRVKITLVVMFANVDVPFSYTQKDLLTNGREVVYDRQDGIYTGVNSYDVRCEAEEEKA